MPTSQIKRIIHSLSTMALLDARTGADRSDGQLLESFIKRGEQPALEALVRRHGPMVWGVCRRILPNFHDAEDAYQATFLVLVRKAASISPREKVGNWLYGVARQTALKARAAAALRHNREALLSRPPEPIAAETELRDDLPFLDQELGQLPHKYRVVIVLCVLEGKSRQEAANCLGCPEGTVGSRLARARTILAKRLARHGLVASGLTLTALLSQQSASAAVPPELMLSTIRAATLVAARNSLTGDVVSTNVAATHGVLKAMLVTKFKIVTLIMLSALTCGSLCLMQISSTPAAGSSSPSGLLKNEEPGRPPLPAIEEPGQPAATESKDVKSDEPKEVVEVGDRMFPDGREHDFGKANRGAILKHSFRIVNRFPAPLTLESARVSCGCATTKLNKDVLGPNEEGILEVTVDTRRFNGPKGVTIYVATKLQEFRDELKFSIRANSVEAEQAPAPQPANINQIVIESNGEGVAIRHPDFDGFCKRLRMDQEKGLLVLEGTGDAPAILTRREGEGAETKTVRGAMIKFRPESGDLTVEGSYRK